MFVSCQFRAFFRRNKAAALPVCKVWIGLRPFRCRVLFPVTCDVIAVRNELEQCERLCETALRVSDRKGEEASMILAEVTAPTTAFCTKASHWWALGMSQGRLWFSHSLFKTSGHDRTGSEDLFRIGFERRCFRRDRGMHRCGITIARHLVRASALSVSQPWRAVAGDVPQDRPR